MRVLAIWGVKRRDFPIPYISNEEARRDRIDRYLKDASEEILLVGELTFAITQLVTRHLTKRGLSYDNLAAVLGALEAIKLELYRRVGAPYEDSKIIQNGDVSGYMALVPNHIGPFLAKREGTFSMGTEEDYR